MRPETAGKILKRGSAILVGLDLLKEEQKKEDKKRLLLLRKEVKR